MDAVAAQDWRTAPRKFWLTTERAVIREHYPMGGIDACAPLLPGRSRTSIYQQAHKLGVHSARQKVRVRYAYPRDERVDEQIRFAHQRAPERGDMQRLADRLGRPRWWVTRRARELGLVTPRFAESAWSAEELAILERTAHRPPAASYKALRACGFRRTLTAVVVKRKRLEIHVPVRSGEYTPTALAGLLGLDSKTVTRWIRGGLLRTKSRGDRNAIRERDLRAFFIAHAGLLDLRKMPVIHAGWFVRVLARGAGEGGDG